MDKAHISQRSEGPAPDGLELKLGGATPLESDLRRAQEVQLIVRGVVTGHTFVDKRDKHGDVEATIKRVTVSVDELVGLELLDTRFRGPAGQTKLGDDGETVDAQTGEPVEAAPEIVDAEIVAELPAGAAPDYEIDPETGEVIEDGAHDGEEEDPPEGEEPTPPPPIRHPQVPEEQWAQLNIDQKNEVLETILRMEKLAEVHASAGNPTDKTSASQRLDSAHKALSEDFGITLTDPPEGEDRADEPPPPPISADSPPATAELLRNRKRYLESRGALPGEAARARAEEIAEIDRRLSVQS